MMDRVKMLKVAAVVPSVIPSVTISVIKPLKKLCDDGEIDFMLFKSGFFNHVKLLNYDLVVFCRNVEVTDVFYASYLHENKIPYVYDIDDNFFEIGLNTDIGRYHRNAKRIFALLHMMRYSSCVRVYSDILYETVSEISSNALKVNSYFDHELLKATNSREKQCDDGVVRIVYATSRESDELQAVFATSLEKILKDFNNVEVHYMGAEINSSNLKNHKRVFRHPLEINYRRFIEKFQSVGFSIGLAPMLNDVFHNSKTNNKYREYASCHIAGVYSDCTLYRSCIRDRGTGLLASNDTSDSWYNAIRELVIDDELREAIANSAYMDVEENYSFASTIEVWREIINSNHNFSSAVGKDKCNLPVLVLLQPNMVKSSPYSMLVKLLNDYVDVCDVDSLGKLEDDNAYFTFEFHSHKDANNDDLRNLGLDDAFRIVVVDDYDKNIASSKTLQLVSGCCDGGSSNKVMFSFSLFIDDYYKSNSFIKVLEFISERAFIYPKTSTNKFDFTFKRIVSLVRLLFNNPGRFFSRARAVLSQLREIKKAN